MQRFFTKIISASWLLVLFFCCAAFAQEVQIVTKSFKVMQGELLELTKDYLKIRTEDGVFRVRLSQLNDETYEMLDGLPEDIKAGLAPEPPDKDKEPINFAEINFSDWDTASRDYLKSASKVLNAQGRFLTQKVFSSLASRRKKLWGKRPVTLENNLVDLRAQAEVDLKNYQEMTAPPRLEKYHEYMVDNCKKSIDVYTLALDDKFKEMDALGYEIMKNTRAAYEELLKAYEAVYAPESLKEKTRKQINVQDKLLEQYDPDKEK